MELHLEPPLPLGGGGEGEARWGGEYFARPGPALCPLANVVLPPPEAREEASPNPVPHPHPEPHPHPNPNPDPVPNRRARQRARLVPSTRGSAVPHPEV